MSEGTSKRYRILLVDDSRVARLTLQHLLKSTGAALEIQEAANADEALALFTPGRFDLALIDFNMPGMDGLELAGHLRTQEASLRMVLVTANIQDSIRQRAEALDLDFLGKPATPEQLQGLLRG